MMFVVYLLFCVLLAEATATSTCGVNELPCSEQSDLCISPDQWCDGEYDCPNGSDELLCDDSRRNTSDHSKSVMAVVEAAHFLLNQRKADYGWDEFTPRALIALAFAEKYLPISEKEKSLMEKRLDLQLFFLLRDEIKLATLALHINALYAMCADPRDFHGIDLVEILRSKTDKEMKLDSTLPIVHLTLCLANDKKSDDIDRLLMMYDKNDRVGVKALALIALIACTRDGFRRYESEMRMKDFYLDPQYQETNIDIYSKALICQAYNAIGAETRCQNELQNLQAEDGSFVDFLGTYYTIPAILNMSLADLQCKTRKYKAKSTRQALPSDQIFKPERQIDYSLWIPNGENAGFHTSRVTFEGEKSLFDVMKMTELRNPMYRFKYDEMKSGKKVYYLAGIPNDAEKGSTWTLYRQAAHNIGRNTTDRLKETDGLEWIFPEDGDRFIFQLEYGKM